MAGFWICLIKVSQGFEYASGSRSARICYGILQSFQYVRVTQGVKYALIMPQYAWICLNNAEYATWINSSQYARILDLSDAVHSIRWLYKLLSSYRDRRIQSTVKHMIERFYKKHNVWVQAHQKFFRAGDFVELGPFDKHFIKNTRKKGSTGKHLFS